MLVSERRPKFWLNCSVSTCSHSAPPGVSPPPQTPVRYLKTLLLPVNLLVVAVVVGKVSLQLHEPSIILHDVCCHDTPPTLSSLLLLLRLSRTWCAPLGRARRRTTAPMLLLLGELAPPTHCTVVQL